MKSCWYTPSMNNSLDTDKLLEFVSFTHEFQRIKRNIFATGEDRNENDAEHSFQLALFAWYCIETQHFNLDSKKVICYALVHDLVEVYAGDTAFHSTDKSLKDSKAQRESDAFEKINAQFLVFPKLSGMIKAYESKLDNESKFVYALDKIIPVINIYLDKGRSWKRDKISYEMVRSKDPKIAISPEAELIWRNLIPILEASRQFFAKLD